MNTAAFGYTREGGGLVHNAQEQATIREMCRLKDQGLSYDKVALYLNDHRSEFPPRGTQWYAASVARIVGRQKQLESGRSGVSLLGGRPKIVKDVPAAN